MPSSAYELARAIGRGQVNIGSASKGTRPPMTVVKKPIMRPMQPTQRPVMPVAPRPNPAKVAQKLMQRRMGSY